MSKARQNHLTSLLNSNRIIHQASAAGPGGCCSPDATAGRSGHFRLPDYFGGFPATIFVRLYEPRFGSGWQSGTGGNLRW